MPRVAFGDLLIDVEIPATFRCEFSLSGSLLAQSDAGDVELSTITVTPKDGGPGFPGVRVEHRDETTALAVFGNRTIITTHSPGLRDAVATMLETVALAHDPFGPAGERVQTCPVRESHGVYFRQRRKSLLDAIDWRADDDGAARALDDFWAGLVENPPDDEDQLGTMIACAAVGFGDLLKPLGFEWCVACDQWGTTLATVALRGTANVVVVPDSFVGKRWESREPRFIEHGVESIRASVERVRARWVKH